MTEGRTTILQYYCGSCQNILKEIDYEISIDSNIEPCPNCGTTLSGVLQKRPLHTRPKKQAVFQKASNLPRLTLGISQIDSEINFPGLNDTICISGVKTQTLAERICIRTQLPQRYGGLDTKVLLIDGANTSDLYQCVDFAHQHGLDLKKALQGIISSRTFTVYQIANLIIYELQNAIKHYGAKIAVITNLLHFFTNNMFADSKEMTQILNQTIKSLKKIQDCVIVITMGSSTKYDYKIHNICIKSITIEPRYGSSLSVQINNNGKQSSAILKKEELETVCI